MKWCAGNGGERLEGGRREESVGTFLL